MNASCAIREILLFDKSMRRNRLKLENAFGVISVMKFCSKRLWKWKLQKWNSFKRHFTQQNFKLKCKYFAFANFPWICKCVALALALTVRSFLPAIPMVPWLNSFHGNQQSHQHIGMDVDNCSYHHIRVVHFPLNLSIETSNNKNLH